MKSRILPVFAAAALAALPAIAHADVIKLDSGDVGNSFTVDYDGYTGSGTIDGLASQIVFTLTGTTDNSYTLSYAVANTSDTPITGSRVSGFGFKIGRAHVCTPVTNAHLVCRLLLEKQTQQIKNIPHKQH